MNNSHTHTDKELKLHTRRKAWSPYPFTPASWLTTITTRLGSHSAEWLFEPSSKKGAPLNSLAGKQLGLIRLAARSSHASPERKEEWLQAGYKTRQPQPGKMLAQSSLLTGLSLVAPARKLAGYLPTLPTYPTYPGREEGKEIVVPLGES